MTLEPGRYRILDAKTSDPINIVCRQPDKELTFCTWNVQNSPVEKWIVERTTSGGYHIRNEATDLYLSFCEKVLRPIAKDQVVGNSSPAEWIISRIGPGYKISLKLNPVLHIAIDTEIKSEGKELIFLSDVVRRPRWTVNDQGSPTSEHLSWLFIEEPGDEPPLYRRNSHIGPIPSGVYWLGQAEIRTTSVYNATKLLSTGALTVTSQALQEQSATPLHLSPLQDRPWPHQVWMIESGMRGYSLKNLVTNTYLTLVDREVVTETLSPDSVPFEWSIREFSRRRPDDIQSYTLSPSTDLSCFLTINFDSAFNKAEATRPSWSFRSGRMHKEWRFHAVDPQLLKSVSMTFSPHSSLEADDPRHSDWALG